MESSANAYIQLNRMVRIYEYVKSEKLGAGIKDIARNTGSVTSERIKPQLSTLIRLGLIIKSKELQGSRVRYMHLK